MAKARGTGYEPGSRNFWDFLPENQLTIYIQET